MIKAKVAAHDYPWYDTYANALAWYISGTQSYATKAISVMNAWAKVIKGHTYSNAPLQTGWAGVPWTRAAEIIRYSGAGWASTDDTAFENMLRNVYLLIVIAGSKQNGNWELGTNTLHLTSLRNAASVVLVLTPLSW